MYLRVCLGSIPVELMHLSHHLSFFLQGNNEEHHYEEVALQNQQGSTEMTVYSTACPPSDNMLLYTTVNFLKDGNTLPDDTSSSDFFSNVHGAAHPPAETALYSTVKNPGEL